MLIITQRFWPEITDATLRLTHWLQRLNREGFQVRVLTSRASPEWSRHLFFGRTRIDRIANESNNPFRAGRYTRELQQRINSLATETDLIYVDNVDSLAAVAVLGQSRTALGKASRPVVVRYDISLLSTGHSHGWQPGKAILDVCRRSDAIFAACGESQRSLLAHGVVQTPIVRVDDWQGPSLDRSLGAKRNARGVLRTANHDLHLRATDLLVLCPGELRRAWGIELLIQALAPILQRNRRVKLWILGDGPCRAAVYDTLEAHDLQRVVTLPGVFTNLEQVLQLADLCVFPARGQGLTWLAPTCAASNIPMLLADSSAARRFCLEEPQAMLFQDGNAADLRYKVESWLRNATPLTRAALKLQRVALSRQEQASDLTAIKELLRPRPSTDSTNTARSGR